jgi:hypothetical protein
MLAREIAPLGAVNGLPCFADSIEHFAHVNAIVCPIDVAWPAARNEVCHDCLAAVFARQQMIKLGTFDR